MTFLRLIRIMFRSAERWDRRRTIARIVETESETVVSIRREALHATRGAVLRGEAWVVDGDTIVIDNIHIRLAGIDAPELDHPYGRNARRAMMGLCRGQTITARFVGELSYNRGVAVCTLPDGRDLAAELVKQGLAVDWPKFSGGRYRHLEPTGVRKKLSRCDARQRGRMPPQSR